MANELVNRTTGEIMPATEYTREQIDLIRKTVANGANDLELQLFLYQARRTGLDPLLRQIHWVRRGDSGTIQVAIDGYRLIADRTGSYAGNDAPEFGPERDGHPEWARVTVWKLVAGERRPFSHTAYWDEYYPGDRQGHMWRKMPRIMLSKCAEAGALRKAFPADLSGVYTDVEMEQATQHEPSRRAVRRSEQTIDAETVQNHAALWQGPGLCPKCNAPEGKRHAKPCI